jgi:WXG100 family type VII secretion target
MAHIIVNHENLRRAADTLDEKSRDVKSKVRTAGGLVDGSLKSGWEGLDYTQFQIEWKDDVGKATDGLIQSMEQYANLLRFAGKKYQEAQADAVNRSNWIVAF